MAILSHETQGLSMKPANNASHNEAAATLTKAVIRACVPLGLNQREMGAILGLSEASASRLFKGEKTLSPRTKEGELALLLIRIYRSLDAILSGHGENIQMWLTSHNDYLGATPKAMLANVSGLVEVANYLDAMRGKL